MPHVIITLILCHLDQGNKYRFLVWVMEMTLKILENEETLHIYTYQYIYMYIQFLNIH